MLASTSNSRHGGFRRSSHVVVVEPDASLLQFSSPTLPQAPREEASLSSRGIACVVVLIFNLWLLVINWVAASTLHDCDLVLLDLDKPLRCSADFSSHPLILLTATG